MSIGLTTISSRSRSRIRNFPRRRIALESLSVERIQLGGRAANGEGPGRLRADDGAARQRRVERLGDHGEIGQLRHGA